MNFHQAPPTFGAEMTTFVAPSDALAIPCVKMNPHRVMARMKLSTLLRLTTDPRKTEKAKERATDFRLQEAYKMRQTVQREFQGIKARNVPKFTEYLIKVEDGEINGLAPAIKLYCPGPVVVQEREDGTALAYISLQTELVAYDGETQLAGWFCVAANRDDLRDVYVPVDISFDRDSIWARQVWHDVNAYGSKPNAALALSMDARDPINQVADFVEQDVPFFNKRVNKMKRQVKPGVDLEFFTLTTFRGACVTLVKGISGVSLGMKPVPGMTDEAIPHVREVAGEYFTAIAATLGSAISDPKCLANSPAVFAAIGAMGHDLLETQDAPLRAAKLKAIMRELADVNWRKGEHWNGIAGKVTTTTTAAGHTRSRFSLAGPKEAAHTVFKALSDPKHPFYKQVRDAEACVEMEEDDAPLVEAVVEQKLEEAAAV